MKTLTQRAATLAWICAIVVFGVGTLIFAASAVMRALTAPTLHAEVTFLDGDIVQSQEVRRPTLFETIEGTGIHPDHLAMATCLSFVVVFLGACAVPWWYIRQAPASVPGDSQSMQELHRIAEQLSERLRVRLETILLDPSRQSKYWERERI